MARDAAHAAAIVLGREHASLAIHRQAIRHASRERGQLRSFGQPPPACDALVRNVAEEQLAATPHRSLGESKAAGEAVDGSVRGDEIVQARIANFEPGHRVLLDDRSSGMNGVRILALLAPPWPSD